MLESSQRQHEEHTMTETRLTATAAQNITGVKINLEMVHVGDHVAENRTPWIKAMVIGIEEGVSEYTGKKITTLTVAWLKTEREGNMIARAGRPPQYSVNEYGVSDETGRSHV